MNLHFFETFLSSAHLISNLIARRGKKIIGHHTKEQSFTHDH